MTTAREYARSIQSDRQAWKRAQRPRCMWCGLKCTGLAHKQAYDPAHYDLEEWLRVRNPRAMEYITQAEVDEVTV